MKEQLISLPTAQLAKEKGFDWQVTAKWEPHQHGNKDLEPYLTERMGLTDFNSGLYGTANLSAPTPSLLQKWLREIHGIHIDTEAVGSEEEFPRYIQMVYTCPQDRIDYELKCLGFGDKDSEEQEYDAYEEALEAGLQEALKTIKNDK